jgi:hypothetical protein
VQLSGFAEENGVEVCIKTEGDAQTATLKIKE